MSEVYKAINAVQADLCKEGIAKTSKNQQQGYNFRGIDAVYNALSPLLSQHGLVIVPKYTERTVTERETQKGGALFNVVVKGVYTIASTKDGSHIEAELFGEAMDSADKATNKAMSAAYKYLCLQLFAIPTEGDNDADATTHEVKGSVQAQRNVAQQRITQLQQRNHATQKPSGAVTEDLLKSYLRRASKNQTEAKAVYAELGDLLEKAGGQDFADQCWSQAIAQADPVEAVNEVVTLLYRSLKSAQEPAA